MRKPAVLVSILVASCADPDPAFDEIASESRISVADSKTIAAGDRHTCALKWDGTVRCVGNNAYGQLGDGTTTNRLTPVSVVGSSGVTAIAAGRDHTCALATDGRILCWGRNDFGQLGDGTTVKKTTPTPVAGAAHAYIALAAGDYHTCGVQVGGLVRCWGRGSYGQLGQGAFASSTVPVTVSGLTDAIGVAAGGNHACANRASGAVSCWGRNHRGQLGNGLVADRSTPAAVALGNVESVTAGGNHTCALATTGELHCWGDNTSGQLATPPGGMSTTPVAIPTAVAIELSTVDAGENYTCALDASGTVICWGLNANAQLGRGAIPPPAPPDHEPTRIPALDGVVGIAAGHRHGCAQLASGVLRCWGQNASGQIGDGTTTQRSSPVANGFAAGLRADAAGGIHFSCGLRYDGYVKCWGHNAFGQLGDGTTTDRVTPGLVAGLDRVEAIDALYEHACAVRADGTVWCWGANASGQVSDKSGDHLVPIQMPDLAHAVDVATGFWHTCALRADGTVWCWGSNSDGQLGDGSYASSTIPVQVIDGPGAPLSDAVEIGAGALHTCVLRQTGEVSCWGSDYLEQLAGAGDSPTPVRISLVRPAIELGIGTNHNCVLLHEGAVWCWGANDFGQADPRSSALLQPTPTRIVDFEDAEEVAAGAGHSCALRVGGTVFCWGDNRMGQVGDGAVLFPSPPPSLPVKVDSLDNVNHLELGINHSLVVSGDGRLKAWGHDFFGQLGDGATGGSSSTWVTVLAFP